MDNLVGNEKLFSIPQQNNVEKKKENFDLKFEKDFFLRLSLYIAGKCFQVQFFISS